MATDKISEADEKAVTAFGKHRGDKIAFKDWVEVKAKRGSERRLLCVGNYRIYLLKTSKKGLQVVQETHFLNDLAVKSPSDKELILEAKGFAAHVTSPKVNKIISTIRNNLHAPFPNVPEDQLLDALDVEESRLTKLKKSESPCGNFYKAYRAMCDLYNVAAARQLSSDCKSILGPKKIRTLNLNEFGPYRGADLRCLLGALKYNTYFKAIRMEGIPLDKDELGYFCDLVRTNKSLEEMSLKGCLGVKDSGIDLANALLKNNLCSLTILNLANSNIDEKGLVSLSNWIGGNARGLTQISIANCNIKKNGMIAFGNALKKNLRMAQTLAILDLSGNRLEAEGSNALTAFLKDPGVLQVLKLANCQASVTQIFGALSRGTCADLREVDFSGNKIMPKQINPLITWLSGANHLQSLNLSNTQLPIPALMDLLSAIFNNVYITKLSLTIKQNGFGAGGAKPFMSLAANAVNLVSLDISDNALGDEGVHTLFQGLCHAPVLKKLVCNNNMSVKRTGSRLNAVESMGMMLSSDCPLEELSFAYNRLGDDMYLFFEYLHKNNTLTSLNITGNKIGDRGAQLFGRVLQVNSKLSSLIMDDNEVSPMGYQAFGLSLQRNSSLKEFPLPFADMSRHMTSGAEFHKIMQSIMARVALNNAPKRKVKVQGLEQSSMLMGGAHLEYLSQLNLKIIGTGKKVKKVNKVYLQDAENFGKVIQGLQDAKEGSVYAFQSELIEHLQGLQGDVAPVFKKAFTRLQKALLSSLDENSDTMTEDNVKDLADMLAKEDGIEDEVYAEVTSDIVTSLLNKATEAFTAVTDVSTNYIFDILSKKMEDIAESLGAEVDDDLKKQLLENAKKEEEKKAKAKEEEKRQKEKKLKDKREKDKPKRQKGPKKTQGDRKNKAKLARSPRASTPAGLSKDSVLNEAPETTGPDLNHATRARPKIARGKRRPPTRGPRRKIKPPASMDPGVGDPAAAKAELAKAEESQSDGPKKVPIVLPTGGLRKTGTDDKDGDDGSEKSLDTPRDAPGGEDESDEGKDNEKTDDNNESNDEADTKGAGDADDDDGDDDNGDNNDENPKELPIAKPSSPALSSGIKAKPPPPMGAPPASAKKAPPGPPPGAPPKKNFKPPSGPPDNLPSPKSEESSSKSKRHSKPPKSKGKKAKENKDKDKDSEGSDEGLLSAWDPPPKIPLPGIGDDDTKRARSSSNTSEVKKKKRKKHSKKSKKSKHDK